MDLKKSNNKFYKKLREEKATLWSFSSVSGYENCPHEYFLGRVKKMEGDENIYSKSGSLSHDILEKFYIDELQKEDMLSVFNKGILEIFTDGYRFPSEKIEYSYLDNMRRYFSDFKKDDNIKECEVFVSMPMFIFDKKLKDNYMQGWVDAILEDDGNISIGDFKSSTIFTGKNLLSKSKQLILYAIAYEYLYKKKVKSVFFDFLKYANVVYLDSKGNEKSKIVERKDAHYINNIVRIEKAYVFVELTQEIKDEVLNWFIKTIYDINSDKVFNKGNDTGKGKFFCEKLCGQKKNCKYFENIIEK